MRSRGCSGGEGEFGCVPAWGSVLLTLQLNVSDSVLVRLAKLTGIGNDAEVEGEFVDAYTNQPLDLEDAALWNQDEPNDYRGAEDCLAVSYSDQRTGLEDQSCSASQSCVLCSLQKSPRLELRGACPQQSLDLRYSLVLEQHFSGLYQLQGWAHTWLEWNNINNR